MAMTDPIADMLTRIRNGLRAEHDTVVIPASKMKIEIARILKQEGVISIDLLKTRTFASRIYVDLEISADGQMTLSDAHEIAHRIHDRVEQEIPDVKHIMIHVNPAQKTES